MSKPTPAKKAKISSLQNENSKHLPVANEFLDFVNESVTPFHAVETASDMLLKAGFQKISEKEKWNIKQNGKYFFTRNQSSLVAFAVGGKFSPGNGFNVIGAHTDSPNFHIKPNSTVKNQGFLQIAVEPYGGGLWPTWFDRDLTVAGRVIVKEGSKFRSRLVKIDRPILRIPTVAIHLHREQGTKLEFNKQTHLLPIMARISNDLEKNVESQGKETSVLMTLLSEELGCNVDDIEDFELNVCDTQKACLGGVFNEFIFSPRLDNLMMSFCSLKALLACSADEQTLSKEENVHAVVLFDNEEVGSQTAQGAGAPILVELIRRINNAPALFELSIRKSFLVSADMAHSVHPNYPEKHDGNHKPEIHKGMVIKINANQRYATVASTSFFLRQLAKKNNIPIQDFVVRNDSPCGSTIGPIIAGNTGIRTVDVGIPQLSMHSIREMCGTSDITHTVDLFQHFFQQFSKMDKQLIED